MGITIFYQGALRDVGQMSQLTAQIQAVCARLQWPCRVVDERILGIAERFEISQIETDDGIPTSTLEIFPVRVDDHVRGIAIAPPDCETLRLIFDRDGRLIDYDSGPSQEQQSGRYGLINKHLWIKTQFSSPEVHIQVCELLRIVEPFMAEWEVTDDGGYWGVWDVQVLRTTWARFDAIFAALSDPATMQQVLADAGLDIKVTKPPEVGKQLTVAHPLWRQEWGISAGEN